MTLAQIKEAVQAFAEGARRAREAGLDGVELHGANGYLITQFLSSAINDRKDEYGGVLANRAKFVREIVQAIRARVGRDFHLQMKISATEFNNAILPDEKPGTVEAPSGLPMLEDDGVDASRRRAVLFASKNPGGDLPMDEGEDYDSSSRADSLGLRNPCCHGNLRGDVQDPGETRAVRRIISKGQLRMPARQETVARPCSCTGGFPDRPIIEAASSGEIATAYLARPLSRTTTGLVSQGDRPVRQSVHVLQPGLVNAPENQPLYRESGSPSVTR